MQKGRIGKFKNNKSSYKTIKELRKTNEELYIEFKKAPNEKWCPYINCIQQMCKDCDCWKESIIKKRRQEAQENRRKQKLSYRIKQWLINKIKS